MSEQGQGEALYLPGAASLVEQIDTKILIVLRDGRNLIGTLRSFDQYVNLILEDTFERVVFQGKYCDIPLGLFLVRGDNLVLLGELDEELEQSQVLQRVSPAELTDLLAGGEEA
ncbi:LSM1 protein, partial [Ochromonadaceae sp. CCMP2298]